MENPKYIANGTYGCVLKPPLACKDSKLNISDTITKIFDDENEKNQEVLIHNKIVKKIDPKNYFTVKLVDDCKINISDYPKNEIIKCSNFKRNSIKYLQIIYENGGLSLDDYMRDPKNPFIDFKYFERIFKGLVELNKNKSSHLDIKPSNIVYNSKTNKMCLIDFGLFSKTKNVYSKENQMLHGHDYYFYPTEFSIYYHRDLITTNYDDIMKQNRIQQFCKLWNIQDFIYKTNYDNLDKFYAKDISKLSDYTNYNSMEGFTRKYLDKYAYKVDIYMLGISLLVYLSHKTPDYNSNPNLYKKIGNLICNMINLDPELRYGPIEAYETFQNILIETPIRNQTPIINIKSPRIINPIQIIKPCPPGKERNIITKRCRKIKIKEYKSCPPGKERNPITNRCRKIKTL